MAKTKTNDLITELLKQNATLIATLNAMMNESSSKKSTTKGSKSTTKTTTKGSKTKAKAEAKDEAPKNSYRVSRIHPSDYLDAFAYKLFINNLISETLYDSIRTCHDTKQRQKHLDTLQRKVSKWNEKHETKITRPSQQDVLDIFHRNGWTLKIKTTTSVVEKEPKTESSTTEVVETPEIKFAVYTF